MTSRQFLACAALLLLNTAAPAAMLKPDLRQLDTLPVHSVPLQQVQKLLGDALSKNRPLQFAVSAPMSLSLGDGAWKELDDGSWSWRTRVFSAGAETLNLHFSKFHLPPGATLWLYDPSGTAIAGPYDHRNDLGDGQLWTSVVDGDTLIVELRVPAAIKDQVRLQLSEVNHGYRGFANDKAGTGRFEKSGSCETDVACPVGQSYLDQARALARITINGNTLCSGQLVNNVRRDNTPFFLTANHCGISSSNAGSVVFYWNYQNSVCGGNGAEPGYQTQSGSVWISGNQASDFTLIKTGTAPSSLFNLYLAGWNASADVPKSGGTVHHPQGDVTKITVFGSPAVSKNSQALCTDSLPVTNSCTATRNVDVWQVSYTQGITEPGSSGAALYDQNRRIVGQLSGGSSSCSNQGGSDIYGRTNAAWPVGLKSSLDPDNSGTLRLDGMNLGTAGNSVSTPGSGESTNNMSSDGGGGALPPVTLLGLSALLFLRRRFTSRRASSV